MLAVILAAGRGTRMGALTEATPKPLLHLQRRPILEHVLRGVAAAGIEEAVVVTGYRGEQIETYFADGAGIGLHLQYRRQVTQDGTARALLLCADAIGKRTFIVSWGDVVIEAREYGELVDDYRRTPCDVLLSLNAVDDPWRGAAVYVDAQGRVTRLIEKPPPGTSATKWNNAGIFVAAPILLDYAARQGASPRQEHELPQAVEAMIADGCNVRGHPLRGFWSDLGTPQDLAAAERSFPGGWS